MIYYLVQGEAYQYADRMAEMADSGAEVIFLTWDKQIDGALFLPNSTWAQGRNFLLQHVLKNNYNFEYLVFIDGDARPIKGSWQEFNEFLINKKPQACMPLMLYTQYLLHNLLKRLNSTIFIPKYQRALAHDTQVVACRKDVIHEVGKIMHPTIFDNLCWHYNGMIFQAILKYLMPHNIIQFNGLEVGNNSHLQYPIEHDGYYITNFLEKIGLLSLFPVWEFKSFNNINLNRVKNLLNSFIELFYFIPFPIKEFDVAKRAVYVKQCLKKIKTIDIPESKKAEDCINT